MYRSPFNAKCVVTFGFKATSKIHPEPHTGLDIVSQGDKTVVAVAAGTVVRIFTGDKSWGNAVIYKLGDGNSCLCAHFVKTLVKVGDKVKKGDPIGIEGETGNATGVHLHIEFEKGDWKYNQNLINPVSVINFSDFSKDVPPAPAKHMETLKAGTWYVRSGAGTSYKVIGVVKGVQSMETKVMSGNWRQVTYGRQTGYIGPGAF